MKKRVCLTSGMIMQTIISDESITIFVKTPKQKWDEPTAKEIDNRLHDGIEHALAPYWSGDLRRE